MSLEQLSELSSIVSGITSIISIVLVFIIKDNIVKIDNKLENNQNNNSGTIVNAQNVNISGTNQSSDKIIERNK